MSLKFITAESTSQLIECFLVDFGTPGAERLFQPQTVIIPNLNITRYLEMQLAKRAGSTIGYRFLFLENALSNLISNLISKNTFDVFSAPKSPIKNLSREIWQMYIYAILARKCPNDLSSFLHESGSGTINKARAFALAGQLSALFQHYTAHYPEIIHAFSREKIETEAFFFAQKYLYKESIALAKKNGYLTLEKFPELLEEQEAEISPDTRIALFTPGYLSAYHLNLLQLISRKMSVSFYTLRLPKKGFLARNSPLGQWSIPSERFIQNVQNIFGKDLEVRENANTSDNVELISIFQQEKALFFSAPGIWREVETVSDLILYYSDLFNQDTSFSMNDIAVLCSDVSKYRAAVSYIFSERGIPWNLTDMKASVSTRVSGTIRRALGLITENAEKRAFVSFIADEYVMNALGYDSSNADTIIDFLEKNSYRNNHPQPTEEERVYTLKSILERTVTSRIRTPVLSLDKIQITENIMESPSLDDENLQILITFWRIMEEYSLKFQKEDVPAIILCEYLRACIKIPDDDKAESILLEKLISDLLETYSLYSQNNISVSFTLWSEILETMLEDIPIGKGKYLSGGVSVSSLMPMRPVPFRIIFLLGMTRGEYPSEQISAEYDLHSLKKYARENDTRTDFSAMERAQNIFMEILLSVKDHLVVSCQSRDIVKDIRKEPCDFMTSLVSWASELSKKKTEIVEVPLADDNKAYFRRNSSLPEPFRKFHAKNQSKPGAESDTPVESTRFYPTKPISGFFKKISDMQVYNFLKSPDQFTLYHLLNLQNLSALYLENNYKFTIGIRNDKIEKELVSLLVQRSLFSGADNVPLSTADYFSILYSNLVENGQAGAGQYAKHYREEIFSQKLRESHLITERIRKKLRGEKFYAVYAGESSSSLSKTTPFGGEPGIISLNGGIWKFKDTEITLGTAIQNVAIHGSTMQIFQILTGKSGKNVLEVKEDTVLKNISKEEKVLRAFLQLGIFLLSLKNVSSGPKPFHVDIIELYFISPDSRTGNQKEKAWGIEFKLGVKEQDRIVHWLENCLVYLYTYHEKPALPILEIDLNKNTMNWKRELDKICNNRTTQFGGRDIARSKLFTDPYGYYNTMSDEQMLNYSQDIIQKYHELCTMNASVLKDV